MDELTPLRSTRDLNRRPSDEALAAGRAALLNRADSDPAPSASPEVRDGGRSGRPRVFPQRRPGPRWVAPAVAVALTAVVVGVLVPVFALGGNGTPLPATSATAPAPSITATPTVTVEMYENAYDEFAKCMSENGSPLSGEFVEGMQHRYSDLTANAAVYSDCYADFAQIDYDWQVAHTNDLLANVALRLCLTDIGVTPAANIERVWEQGEQHDIDTLACLTEKRPLLPTGPYLAVADEPSTAAFQASLAGELALTDDGCFGLRTAGGEVQLIVFPARTRILADLTGLQVPDHGAIIIGEDVSGDAGFFATETLTSVHLPPECAAPPETALFWPR